MTTYLKDQRAAEGLLGFPLTDRQAIALDAILKALPKDDTFRYRSDDSALVSAIVPELSQYDIWVAHNGARFDVPFLRTRLAKWGFDPLPSKKLVDPVQLARNKLRMSFNSLAAIGNFLGFNSKTEVKGDL